MADPIMVSHVRVDGRAHLTTFEGYGAETCAFSYFRDLKSNKTTLYAVIIQDQPCRDGVTRKFETLQQYISPGVYQS